MKRTVLPSTGIDAATQAALDTKAALADPWKLGFPASAPPLMASAQSTTTANRATYVRVVGAGTITSLLIRVAVQSGNVCAGVFANSGSGRSAVPAARVATSGSVACAAAGVQTLTLDTPIAVTHGSHWLAFACDNGTASFHTAANFLATGIYDGCAYFQDTAFPLPTTAGSLTAGLAKPVFMVGV